MRSLFFAAILIFYLLPAGVWAANPRPSWWEIESIDTMKYSRDLARQKLSSTEFIQVIDLQIKNIAATGATHVAVATPYDEEFIPFLKEWVAAARKYHLSVWFRGNFSGWEGWFGYPKISRVQHQALTRLFITSHPELFANGDIFTACPECENGGPGDPRRTRDISDYRQFLISEHQLTSALFKDMDKNIRTNFNSTNADVARLIMDRDTTKALGGIIAVDHYVSSPSQLAADLKSLAAVSGGQVVLSEFGSPIPDIHGSQSPSDQVNWLKNTLTELAKTPSVIGVNYWTSVGGSTELWNSTGQPRPAVAVLTSFYFPKTANGRVKDVFGRPISKAQVASSLKSVTTDSQGNFQLPFLDPAEPFTISASGYITQEYNYYSGNKNLTIYLEKSNKGILFKLKYLIFRLLGGKISN